MENIMFCRKRKIRHSNLYSVKCECGYTDCVYKDCKVYLQKDDAIRLCNYLNQTRNFLFIGFDELVSENVRTFFRNLKEENKLIFFERLKHNRESYFKLNIK